MRLDQSLKDYSYDEVVKEDFQKIVYKFSKSGDKFYEEKSGCFYDTRDFKLYTDCGSVFRNFYTSQYPEISTSDTRYLYGAGKNVYFVIGENSNLKKMVYDSLSGEENPDLIAQEVLTKMGNLDSYDGVVIPLKYLSRIIYFDKDSNLFFTDFMPNNKYENSRKFIEKLENCKIEVNDDYLEYSGDSSVFSIVNSSKNLDDLKKKMRKDGKSGILDDMDFCRNCYRITLSCISNCFCRDKS